MTDLNWVLRVVSHHPTIWGAMATAHDEWVEVLLSDNRTFRFRPFSVINQDAPEEAQRTLLNELIEIGAANATPASFSHGSGSDQDATDAAEEGKPHLQGAYFGDLWHTIPDRSLRAPHQKPEENAVLLPIVRSATDLQQSSWVGGADGAFVLYATDFITIGIAADTPEGIRPLSYSDLGFDLQKDSRQTTFQQAIQTLRAVNQVEGNRGIALEEGELAGASVLIFASPEGYQSSWFADQASMGNVANAYIERRPNHTPLFVPATRTSFFIVDAADPHLPSLFEYLYTTANTPETIYPLPHVLGENGWEEWIPEDGHPAAAALSKLRSVQRANIYDAQQQAINEFSSNLGQTQSAIPVEVAPDVVTVAQWKKSFGRGSIPVVDFINFIDDTAGSDGASVWVPFIYALELWPEGFTDFGKRIRPPRQFIDGFPDAEALERLAGATEG